MITTMLNLQVELCRLHTSMYASCVSSSESMNGVYGDAITYASANNTAAYILDNEYNYVDDNDNHPISLYLTSVSTLHTDDNNFYSLSDNDSDFFSTYLQNRHPQIRVIFRLINTG
ncbi:unnamed protein product [Schistosoma spindalis]|nr:unnamed protein product [Schistosoma spindale]